MPVTPTSLAPVRDHCRPLLPVHGMCRISRLALPLTHVSTGASGFEPSALTLVELAQLIRQAFAFEFGLQFLLRRQIRQVLRSEHGAVVIEERVLCHRFALVGAQDETDGRVVVGSSHLVFPVADIEVHLADVAMVEGPGLQIDDHEALEDVVVEDDIDVVVRPIDRDALLAAG